MQYSITLIGAVGAEPPPFDVATIAALLGSGQAALVHGSAFTGRPGTSLYSSADCVLKIRNEIRLNVRSATIWARQAVEKERSYGVHHPSKTWFLALPEGETEPFIGNICPRLQPLHTLLNGESPPVAPVADKGLRWLEKLLDQYCRVAKSFQIRLDEGLSNFGISLEPGDEALYYLDDDTYNWDRFTSCAHTLGVFFRSLTWLNEERAEILGRSLRRMIAHYFGDPQYATVLTEQLRDVFIPAESQRRALQAFTGALSQHLRVQADFSLQASRYIALLADVHANLPALRAVLEYLRQQGIERGLVLGDVVGYGPYPAECIELLRQSGLTVLKGNHDHGLATGSFRKGFSNSAAWVLEWSQERISAEQKKWLEDLPPVMRGDGWMALHGAPVDTTFFNAYVYEMTYERNLDVLQEKQLPLCFHGHTHMPGIYARYRGADQHYLADTLDVGRFDHVLLCPGSVGQPRNHQRGAQFAIYDRESREARFLSVEYALEEVTREMRNQDFPAALLNILEGKY